MDNKITDRQLFFLYDTAKRMGIPPTEVVRLEVEWAKMTKYEASKEIDRLLKGKK